MKLEILPVSDFPGKKALVADPLQTYLDADKIAFPLKIRSWRDGDSFTPSGLGGKSVNLADFLAKRKIPVEVRRNIPLVLSNEEIIWVAGVRAAESALVSPSTMRLLHIELYTTGKREEM